MVPFSRLTVVVADGGRARFLSPRPHPLGYATAQSMESVALHQKTADLTADRLGRSFESASPTRHAIQPRHDPHDQAKHEFAARVAEAINAGIDEAVFDHILLAAPAPVLSEIEHALSPKARERLVATLPKDLTRTPDQEIAEHVLTLLHRT